MEARVAVLASERAESADLDALDEVATTLEATLEDFVAYRQADIRLHVGLAEATRSTQLVRAMTETELFAVCDQHLLTEPTREFSAEPYPGIIARPNCETPVESCSLDTITS